MKSQLLDRISYFFSSSSSSSSSTSFSSSFSSSDQSWGFPTKVTTTDYYCHTVQSTTLVSNKLRWATFNLGKKTSKNTKKCNGIPAAEWLASPLNADSCDACRLTRQCFYDEKVEILAPSASTASFITSSSTTTLPQHIPYYFSSLSSSPLQSDQRKQNQQCALTPPTSINEREKSGIAEESERKNTDFCHTYKSLSIQIYNKDDFYD
ncbi:Phospholipase D1 [Mucor velutinosus]|uniref:Phospholipase D1 n=1 Tax=Mucor velutinosus TaxID=708070 RepID=A0AAN7HYH2_9FUNG|nr:Phospholipase D1 [Mucor velutinosus]